MEDRSTRTTRKKRSTSRSMLRNVPTNRKRASKRKLEDDSTSAASKKRSIAPDFPAVLFTHQKASEALFKQPRLINFLAHSTCLFDHQDSRKQPQASKHYFGDRNESQLSKTESKLWSQPIAAKYAANHHPPAQTVRLLGVITRRLKVVSTPGRSGNTPRNARELCAKHKLTTAPPLVTSQNFKARPPTVGEARTQAKADAARNEGSNELTAEELMLEAGRIKVEWQDALKGGAFTPGFDARGELALETVDPDPDYITCSGLLQLIESNVLADTHAGERRSLYNGLCDVPVDTVTVLESLLELADPEGLYEIPLINAYPILRAVPTSSTDQSSTMGNHYNLTIGVYCNRLLFEVMTCQKLQIIMSALDGNSYRVTQPLHLPPMRPKDDPAFASDPNQVVVFQSDDDEGNDDDGSQTMDALLQGSTCDQSEVDAFTIKGFLKLIENHGNDISNWPQIERTIAPSLKIRLLLHQIHGVCWMLQMENLGGFGINSIVWQERTFMDGGKYYYSPATGQARLDLGTKKVMKGGILADEMGLGKTVQVLGLVLATLEELKQEAESKPQGSNHKHATLIVVPPALVSQWFTEIEKITGDSLVYEFFDCRTFEFHRKSTKDGPADIVVTTYSAFQKFSNKRDPGRILKSSSWGRVVLDEMQEIRSATKVIAKNCEGISCERRWMLSGTPLFDGVEDLRGELNFLRVEPFAASLDDGFFDFSIKNHWEARSRHGLDTLRVLSLLMLRRSKSMTVCSTNLPLLGLKPLTITFEPVPQKDPSERALYCFLEYLVHATIDNAGDGDETKNRSFLRLLRQMCASPALLNGGLGCSSQLQTLNCLMVDHNRREHSRESTQLRDELSCDEAIRFLSQISDVARVDEGFETSLVVGGGGGIARRDRALDSTEQQYEEIRKRVARAVNEFETARSKRAVARWHRALEGITTGQLPSRVYKDAGVSSAFLNTWKLRSTVLLFENDTAIPSFLKRGWRPSEKFFETASSKKAKLLWHRALEKTTGGEIYVPANESMSKLSKRIRARWRWRFVLRKLWPGDELPKEAELMGLHRRPAKAIDRVLGLKWLFSRRPDFPWAHPFALLLRGIPKAIREKELHQTFVELLENLHRSANQRDGQSTWKLRTLRVGPLDSEYWNAYVLFSSQADFKFVLSKAKSVEGIRVCCTDRLPRVEEEIAMTKMKLDEAVAENKVYPCDANARKERKARKAHQIAQLGLRILSKERHRGGHVSCSRALGPIRTNQPKTAARLFTTTEAQVTDMAGKIAENRSVMSLGKRKMKKLEAILSKSLDLEDVTKSTVETLQALREGDADDCCALCLYPYGTSENSDGKISLLRCSHMFCTACFEDLMIKMAAEGQHSPPCPFCRRRIHRGQVVQVDPKRTADQEAFEERRSKAKSLILEASEVLDASNGRLDPHLWEALYLAIDVPPDADQSLHSTFSALPSHFLAHLRHATGMPVHSARNAPTEADLNRGRSLKFSSKIQALLADLPRDERSVVFASAKQNVEHLLTVLKMKGIGCRGLFTGQSEQDSERSVEEWQSSESIRVLVVQAGAAACGLTLTAASKMFLLEPFIKHEEEKQAYARLHRFGQQKEVQCKVYYTPVSVESRLLEWRKRATNTSSAEEKTIYAPMRSEGNEGDDEDAENAEWNRTRFLLGLTDDNGEGMDVDP